MVAQSALQPDFSEVYGFLRQSMGHGHLGRVASRAGSPWNVISYNAMQHGPNTTFGGNARGTDMEVFTHTTSRTWQTDRHVQGCQSAGCTPRRWPRDIGIVRLGEIR
jgi:hypothetical protein